MDISEHTKLISMFNSIDVITMKQIKTSIDLYRFGVASSIYTLFVLNIVTGKGYNSVTEIKNGIIVDFYDYNDRDYSIKFKIAADDKLLFKGTINNMFGEPEFDWESKLCYNETMSKDDLMILRQKWELIMELLDPNNIIPEGWC